MAITTNVRIIFRGLIAYRFEPEDTPSTLTAYLINGKSKAANQNQGKKRHDHMPKFSWIGVNQMTNFAGETLLADKDGRWMFEWSDQAFEQGITPATSFSSYVPKVSALAGLPSKPRPKLKDPDDLFKDGLVSCMIQIPCTGRIWASDFVRWRTKDDYPPERKEVKFLGGNYGPQFIANECTVELSRKSPSTQEFRLRQYDGGNETIRLERLSAGNNFKHAVEPDTIEILVTNFNNQRSRPLPWSIHYQWFFQLLKDPAAARKNITAITKAMKDEVKGGLPSPLPGWYDSDFNDIKPTSTKFYPFPYVLRAPQNRPICPPAWEE